MENKLFRLEKEKNDIFWENSSFSRMQSQTIFDGPNLPTKKYSTTFEINPITQIKELNDEIKVNSENFSWEKSKLLSINESNSETYKVFEYFTEQWISCTHTYLSLCTVLFIWMENFIHETYKVCWAKVKCPKMHNLETSTCIFIWISFKVFHRKWK